MQGGSRLTTIADATEEMEMKHDVEVLESIQQRVLWLAMRMVHEANHVRSNPSGGKVGGHQSSSASMVTLMTALYFHYLRAGDRVSVKPHASPVFHAIQYLLGRLPKEYLPTLRAFGGLQAYPSRTKDPEPVDFSTGSVGLGAVAPSFAALAHQYTRDHFDNVPNRRFVALLGDAELDEGNIWEAIMDDLLVQLGNVLWIVDLNRQSLDRVVPGIKAGRIKNIFAECGWQVLEAKYGQRLEDLFAEPDGHLLRQRIDAMNNEEYQALIQLPGAELRRYIVQVNGQCDERLRTLLAAVSDADLPAVIGNLGGHDFEKLINMLDQVDEERPTVLFAYTIKGWQLPFAANPLNHSMLLSQEQIDALRVDLDIPAADEWADFPADSAEAARCQTVAERLWGEPEPEPNHFDAAELPANFTISSKAQMSTQQTFGSIMLSLSRQEELAKRIVTVAPDVSTSTNLAGWVMKEGLYAPGKHAPPADATAATRQWQATPAGQHIELGISEMNLFMALGMFGLSAELIGEQLIPIGTVYDPFVCRGLDAFIYGLYSAAKFIIVGTPSGVTLAPEGGAHQSTITSSIGTELPNLNFYEPCYAQELAWIVLEAMRQCCDREHGRSTYLRLSTKAIEQAPFQAACRRIGEAALQRQVLDGGYRLVDWRESGADLRGRYLIQIATTGAMVPEAIQAAEALHEDGIAANVLHLTSPRQLYERWRDSLHQRHSAAAPTSQGPFDWLIPAAERHAPIITVNDGASHALAWLGSALGSTVVPLGVDEFGQSGTRQDLYAACGIDAETILESAYAILQRKKRL